MTKGSYYNEKLADKAVKFISRLTFTKGKWKGKPFTLLAWQENLVRRLFGTCRDGTRFRQYNICYVEIPKKNGKTELAAAIQNYLLFADGEKSAEIFGCAGDREQASLVYDVSAQMVRQDKVLSKRAKIIDSKKRITVRKTNGFYKAVSSEAFTKHGPSLSGVIFDELHTQPNDLLWNVMTVGSGDARDQQCIFVATTAGTNRNSICWRVRERAMKALDDPESDPLMLPIIFTAPDDADWEDEQVWIDCNPSLITEEQPNGIFTIDKIREAYVVAKQTPANENVFRTLRLNQWVRQESRWLSLIDWDACKGKIDMKALEGRSCYGGLDMASTKDIAALVLVFEPLNEGDPYEVLAYFWIPEFTIEQRTRLDHVPYEYWEKEGLVIPIPGKTIDPRYIRECAKELAKLYNIKEVAYDRWGALQLSLELEDEGLTVIPFGQGFASMSPACREFERLVLEGNIRHDGNKALRWMIDNIMVKTDPSGNIKMDKDKSTEKIDGAVALAMAIDRAIRHEGKEPSVYEQEDRGILTLDID